MSKNHFVYRISYHFRSIHVPQFLFLWIFLQNGCRRPFWMSKITFGRISGHFRSIQICYFFLFFTKWLPVAILDVRKSLSISFLAISDRYATLIFFEIFDKMTAIAHFGCPKFTLDHISGHFRSIQIFKKITISVICTINYVILYA